ncbi:hypothetical protein GH733_006408 [Mirounga leonina]|nr:hypothetical protein GH733_006408 [Mirounga leonina]
MPRLPNPRSISSDPASVTHPYGPILDLAITQNCFTSKTTNSATEMRSILIITLLSCFRAAYEAKIFSKWVCMAQYESHFNTQAINRKNADGNIAYGLFQLNSQWWCQSATSPQQTPAAQQFLDDNIDDDIRCAERVARDPKRMFAWRAWIKHCKGRDLSKYLADCNL